MQLFIQVHLFSLSRVDGALFHKLDSTKQYIAYSIIKKILLGCPLNLLHLERDGHSGFKRLDWEIHEWIFIGWKCNVTSFRFVFTINHKMWS